MTSASAQQLVHSALDRLRRRIDDSIRADIGGAAAPKRIQREHLDMTGVLAMRIDSLEDELAAVRERLSDTIGMGG